LVPCSRSSSGPTCRETFYRGAGRIARFRGLVQAGEPRPDDWIASTTSRFGASEGQHGTAGQTRLADGSLLADAIAADPAGWLGREHCPPGTACWS